MTPRPSQTAQILGGAVLLVFSLAVLVTGIADMLHGGKRDPGAYGAVVFLSGLVVLGGSMVVEGLRAARRLERERVEAKKLEVLRLGARAGGLSVADVALHLSVTLPEAEAVLDAMATEGVAEMVVNERGDLRYSFVSALSPALLRVAPVEAPRVAPEPAADLDDELMSEHEANKPRVDRRG